MRRDIGDTTDAGENFRVKKSAFHKSGCSQIKTCVANLK